MSIGFILVLAVLVLGGVIATVGDRLGTKVGKARLSLFNLRPRRTATLITILTGGIIAASTLGILFAASEQLRTGVFELSSIQRRLRKTRADLREARDEREQIEDELEQVRSDRTTAKKQLTQTQQQLTETNQSLTTAIAERSRAQAERSRIETELGQTRRQLATVSAQGGRLRSEITQLQQERKQVIAEREAQIQDRERVIQEREAQLKQLEVQQDYLAREVSRLEREAQGLRQGNLAVQRGQVLATAVVRVVNPELAQQAVDQLLREANRAALQLVQPGTKDQEQIIQITRLEVEQLNQQIDDGQDYVVRISSAANYLVGERTIQVFAEAVPNRLVFQQDDVVAATSFDPSTLSDDQMQQRINLLLAAAGFRARRLGILTDTVQIGRVQNLIAFIDTLKQYRQSVGLKVVAANDTYTAGPLKVELLAEQNGQILFRTEKTNGLDSPTP